ncbi:MAG: pilus assembly protein PilM, partial [Phycisphaerae bacterium]
LVKSFKLSFSKAENLKRTADSSKYARQIFQAMRPIFADLVQELQRSIGFYSSTHRDTHVEKVVCVGNAFKLPGLRKYLQQNLGLPVERPESFKMVVPSGAAGEAEFKEQLLSFAVAYGLALQGLELTKVTSNLLPTEIAKQVVWRKKRPAFAAAAACLVLAGGLIWFRQSADMRALAAGAEGPPIMVNQVEDAANILANGPSSSSDRKRAEAILAAGNLLKKELRSLEGQGDKERAETDELIDLQGNKAVVPAIFQVIHESVPAGSASLAQATTQAEVLERIANNEVPPRNERNQVFIEKLLMRYEANVNSYFWETLVSAPEPINDPDLELGAIKIEITCTTPNHDGPTFISESFMDALRKNGRRSNMGFYFDRVYLVYGSKVETKGSSVSSSGRGSGSRVTTGGRGRGLGPTAPRDGATAPQQAAPSVHPEDLDVVTLEPIENDWRFEIWIDAILEDYPESEEAGAELEEPEGD